MPRKYQSKLKKALEDLGLDKDAIKKTMASSRKPRKDAGKFKEHSISWFMQNEGLSFSQARYRRLKFLENN